MDDLKRVTEKNSHTDQNLLGVLLVATIACRVKSTKQEEPPSEDDSDMMVVVYSWKVNNSHHVPFRKAVRTGVFF
jgi:hypothetical protein